MEKAWQIFDENEGYEEGTPMCFHCGNECSGDVTETIEFDFGELGEFPICDDPDNCPANRK